MYLDGLVAIDIKLYARAVHLVQIFNDLLGSFVEIHAAVLVFHVAHRHVYFVLRRKVNAVLVLRDLVAYLYAAHDRSLVCPATRYVTQGVASTSEKQDWDVELFEEFCC